MMNVIGVVIRSWFGKVRLIWEFGVGRYNKMRGRSNERDGKGNEFGDSLVGW